MRNRDESKSESKKYDVIIVGAGLAGLMAAVKASNAGKRVLVIESRSEAHSAIRPQLIALDGLSIWNLQCLYDEEKKN